MAENHKEKDNNGAEKEPRPVPEDRVVSTRHTLKVKGKELKYTATVGTVVLKEEDDKEGHKPRAEMFFVAFTRDGVRNRAKRPVTFSFNGGPGSSSVWMLLGLLGPRRVPLSDDESGRVEPPYQLEDNEQTLLEETDLVFIDPVGTGYSRPVTDEKQDPDEFYSFKRDIDSVGEFIRLYTSRNQRWSSPKFIIGESYGTTRASGLSGHLQDRYGLFLNGVMLVSVVLNFQTLLFNPGNDLPYVLYLPSYALAARYHGKLPKKYQDMDQDKFLAEVREFAEEDYNRALMKGDRLDKDERNRIVGRLAAYTGLSEAYIEGSNLRIAIMRFAKELLRSDGKAIGRFDSRITGVDRDDVGENFERDPSFDMVQGVYSACLNDYVRRELEFESDLPYEILSFKILPKWKYDDFQNSYVNTAETLRSAIMKNPHLQVFVANGLYDLATPFFATEYTFDHLGLRDGLQKNVSMGYYPAGHMMYSHKASLAAMARDLKQFIKKAC
ncbi:MAG: peptidase S10 [Pseudomonadales bacterium]|nr:peptidase S10 [Pseudomonadales bacterium]